VNSPNNSCLRLLQGLPLHTAQTPSGQVQYRRAGPASTPPSHVMLHGIGSGSASWVFQLTLASALGQSVVAWDAPGYGNSDALPMAQPSAHNYARQMWAWLDALDVHQPVTLVGHSLGCLMAAAAAVQQPQRVTRAVLFSPAQGYARASEVERQRRLDDRLDNLRQWGPQGIAERRCSAMVSATASPELLHYAQWVMAQIQPPGYTQAAHMLAQADIRADLVQLRCPVTVACGDADVVTPPAASQAPALCVAARRRAPVRPAGP
jgi:pimeloyl-ACP methyl ester carboxylesterase